MPDLSTQLRVYLDGTALPLEVEEVVGDVVRVPPRRTPPKKRTTANWASRIAATVAGLLVVLGAALLLPGGDRNDVVDSPPAMGWWPQSNLEEVQQAQAHADAGDPAYTWQLGPRIELADPFVLPDLELVDRFIREVLGWEAYELNLFAGGDGDGWEDGDLTDQHYLRCAPEVPNPLYPPKPGSEQPGESCAPTIDDFRYESVSLDLAQPVRVGRDGIWVVSRWRMTAPFAQTDPAIPEARATERLEEFLAARIAGSGAEGYVRVDGSVPLAYTSTSGAPYERYELELVEGPRWPYGGGIFRARLFADGDATVVVQEIHWDKSGDLWLNENATTENGQPILLSHTSSDGQVTISAPSTWQMWWPEAAHVADVGVWFGGMWRLGAFFGTGERIEFVDPVAYDMWCAENGGAPLLSAPADAATIAQQIIADPNFETTSPVSARVGGVEAVVIDVALAPGGERCTTDFQIEISRWIHSLEPGSRLRLYLVDLPPGMSVDTMAITVVASEDRFDEVLGETAPIIDSIEFRLG